MFEIVTMGALTAFLTSVGNGAFGEMGKQLLISTGAQVRRALGRPVPLPSGPEEAAALARQVHPALAGDGRAAHQWAMLMRSLPDDPDTPPPWPGLPPATRHFTDRDAVLRQLRREVSRPAGGRPRVALLYGPPGIGTSEIALHFGADQTARFPDGSIHLDLRDGAEEHGPEPAAVLRRLLERMGAAPDAIPATERGRVELYRRLTQGRRALIVVDHVTSAAQVRGLIPATPEVFLVVVTSGPGFVLEAESIAVPGLADRHARQLLGRVVGREAVDRAKDRLPTLLAECQGNALALRAAALDLGGWRPAPPSDDPSAAWGGPGPLGEAVRAAGLRLGPEQLRVCRLSALGGWPAVDAPLAALAGDTTEEQAARALAEAVEARLVEELGDGRYRFRPAVRRRLEQLAGWEDGYTECSAAVARVLDGLLYAAVGAARAALRNSWRVDLPQPTGRSYESPGAGMAALTAEVDNLVRAVFLAEEQRHPATAQRLARALWPLQLKAGHLDTVLPALRRAASLADRPTPGPGAETPADAVTPDDAEMAGALYFQLAHCLGELKRWDEADRAARAAVAQERAAGHRLGEASAVEFQGLLRLYRWEFEEAYAHFTEAERIYRTIGPGERGHGDLPRALALVTRHQGRALRGMGRPAESRALLETALAFFTPSAEDADDTGAERGRGEAYNRARVLTDLAETLHDGGEDPAARERIATAERLLAPEGATLHLAYLAHLRDRCRPATD
ncbi:ATP-binding protein [Streptomyces sp. NPDC046887]|uniref:ATP-binding protein n=1 Tax=Streptomyces sp. NPDC046887 TaxID=3155472 RepID=UPI0033D34579